MTTRFTNSDSHQERQRVLKMSIRDNYFMNQMEFSDENEQD